MNSIQVKFHSIIISLTTLLFFSFYEGINNLIVILPIYKILLSGLASLTLYRLIAKLFYYITTESIWLRRKMLGARYMEGTWVGFYIGQQGVERFIIEHYEQDIFQTIIRGQAYKEDREFHTSWISKPANINIEDGEVSYMYDLKGIGENTNGNGIAFFNLTRTNQKSPPTALKGFSADLHNANRTRSTEIKISDKHNISDSEALEKAINYFNENPIF